MSGEARVESYFSAVAAQYHQASGRTLWKFVRDREARGVLPLLGSVSGIEVLDLGCGAGFYTRLLLEKGARHVLAVDFSQRMLDQLPTVGVTAVLGNALTLQLDRQFALAVSAGMLEFVPDPLAALKNAAQMVHDGGALVVLLPTNSLIGRGYRHFHSRHGFAINLFDQAQLDGMARASGWRLTDWRRAGPYSAAARLVRSKVQ